MSEQLKKYLILKRPTLITTPDEEGIQNAVNGFYDLGYKLKQFQHEPDTYFAVMELDTSGYENVTNLKDVPPEEVDHHIVEGWEIASSSISTKFVRMIKRSVPHG